MNGTHQMSIWDKLFHITERGSTISGELFAGATTFLCVAYVLAVNPIILSAGGMDGGAVFTATALSAIIMTLLLAFVSNMPFAGLSGMGINAFFAYTVVVQMGHSFAFALTAQLIAGILFLIIALTPLKDLIFDAIPYTLKMAVTAGIGLFITLIGLSSAGLIVSSPATLVSLGDLHTPNSLIAILGIILIAVFTVRNVKGGIFLAVIISAIVGFFSGVTELPETILSMPPSLAPIALHYDFSEITSVDMIFVVFTFLFVNVFNVVGVLIGLTSQAEVLPDKQLAVQGSAMKVAAIGTIIGSALGTSPHIVAVESAAGIAEGGRTGLTALTIAVLFIASLFVAPLLLVIPVAATAPVLIVVGLFMMASVKDINFGDISEGLPAFLTIIMMPFAYSIGVGIEWGLVSYVVVKVLSNKYKDVSAVMYVLAAIFIVKEILV
ncbi:MAG: NCS2 family permease [Veillonella caviae]|uniref:NCS2 family permease n=1 Tax=Veillonella caviae TaxID=248316 RepID=UPI000F8F060C|nr:NCS2 family permease [Veillonella caviae]MCF0157769.1 NCS2 family permease [Veillonella sp.]MDD7290621.1 NCS2 family permease [Veillonella caviae]